MTYTDSDWAGCRDTGKSTSGGIVMIGSHYIRGWSKNQNSITLSSAEAELVAMVKASTEAIGIMAMAKDLGKELKTEVYADSSAAIGITKRKGSGKLRHINIGLLWVQEKSERGDFEYHKVAGESNPADIGTKNLNSEKITKFCEMLGHVFIEGRAQLGLQVQHS